MFYALFFNQVNIMWLPTILGLLLSGVGSVASKEVNWSHEQKKTFCSMLANRRVYREENLAVFCTVKVQQWKNQVRRFIFIKVFTVNLLLEPFL
jgi:hypothetical protein